MSYQPAGAVQCVPGFTFHRWSASVAWGVGPGRVVETQTCIRCGCERGRVVDRLHPVQGRGWQYASSADARGGDRG